MKVGSTKIAVKIQYGSIFQRLFTQDYCYCECIVLVIEMLIIPVQFLYFFCDRCFIWFHLSHIQNKIQSKLILIVVIQNHISTSYLITLVIESRRRSPSLLLLNMKHSVLDKRNWYFSLSTLVLTAYRSGKGWSMGFCTVRHCLTKTNVHSQVKQQQQNIYCKKTSDICNGQRRCPLIMCRSKVSAKDGSS